jgi:hypothetical protein
MQIKTTMRPCFTPTRMHIIKKMENNKCWLRCGEIGALIHCWWECKNGAATLENNLVLPEKVKQNYQVTLQVRP